ncbi:hypothetical protein J3E71DRAFT_388606 [Bipolaris maydis]|nr:hypothetical protein J3E71DRAFT_388606 [Bipolaris maydis]
MASQLCLEDYTVGWICALPVELAAAEELLDEEHETPEYDTRDTNIYTCGRVGNHNVVIACLPEGQIGTNSAAAVAVQMKSTFTSTRFGLMVGIGGGVPTEDTDVRLGDVVVSKPHKGHGGVVQYDFGKATQTGFERIGSLNSPPTILLNAVARVQAKHIRGRGKWLEYHSKLATLPAFGREAAGPDVLFEAEYNHEGGTTCRECNQDRLLAREPSWREAKVHYGTIASGNKVIKTATKRDRLSAELGGVLCFEMEAAGLMNSFPCLVIRGICDYADSHKNKQWQMYAAGTAAAYAKEVLSIIPPGQVQAQKKIVDVLSKTAAKRQLIAEEHLDIARKRLKMQHTVSEQEFEDRQKEVLQLFRLTKSTQDATYEWYKDRIEDRVEGTCNWFLEHAHFQEWLKQVSGPLLVSADPGCGKSVLAKYLVDHVLQDSATVCYFFFKDQDQNTVCQALCALLHQLFCQKPALLKHAIEQCEQNGEGLINSTKSLWAVLENAVQDSEAGPVIILLDALDECAESEFEDLMRNIEGQSRKSQLSHGTLKYIMTSRPYQQIVGRFQGLIKSFPHIHIPGEEESEAISHEVNRVIEYRVNQLARDEQLSNDTKTALRDALLQVEHRTYLWVYLKTKKGIHQAYEKILSKSKDHTMVQKVLAILLAANRAFTVSELNIATATNETTQSWQDLDLEREEDFKSLYHRRVYFLHQTAREFLIADVSPTASVLQHHAHRILAGMCLYYISFYGSEPRSTTSTIRQDGGYHDAFGFFHYSIQWWPTHFREAKLSRGKDTGLLQLGLEATNPESTCFQKWFPKYHIGLFLQSLKFAPHLFVVSFFGQNEAVKMLLDNGADVNAEGGVCCNALQLASMEGHEQVVKTLLNAGANVDIQTAWDGHREIVKMLLNAGAKINDRVNDQGGFYSSALIVAAVRGKDRVADMLLNTGGNVNSHIDDQGRFYSRALEIATMAGWDQIVRSLVDAGALLPESFIQGYPRAVARTSFTR